MIDFSLKIYTMNKNASSNKTRLEQSVQLTVFIFKAGMALLITTAILTCIRPGISYVFNGKVEPVIPTHFPLLNEYETAGYACLAVFHLYLMFVFVLGTAGCDLGLSTFVIHAYTMSHLFRNAVNEFNVLAVNKKRDKRPKDIMAIRSSLNNLISMHADFIKSLHLNFMM